MIWVDALVLTCLTYIFVFERSTLTQTMSGIVFVNYVALMTMEMSNQSIQPTLRLLTFSVMFVGSAIIFLSIWFKTQSQDHRENNE